MTTAVIIGRFQPLHNGHVALINKALENHSKVLILVGSVNKERDFKNPFSTEVRLKMISNVFEGNTSVYARGLKDKPTDDEWVAEVIANVNQIEEDPSKVVLYTSEKDSVFYEANFLYNVSSMDSEGINATDIRELLYTGEFKKHKKALLNIPQVNWEYLDSILLVSKDTSFWELSQEKQMCERGKRLAISAHKFSNPIEPVAHALVIHDGSVLLVKRAGTRGKGQWAIPGGFIEHAESSRAAAVRELKEETGVDLMTLRTKEMAQSVEENLDDLSVRTLGINYLYLLDPTEEKPKVTLDTKECSDYEWVSLDSVLKEERILFYNHNVVAQRLLSKVK